MRSLVARLLVPTAVATAIVAGLGAPAQADGGQLCYAKEVPGVSGGVSYYVRCVTVYSRGPGGSVGSGGGGVPADTCGLAKALAADAKVGGGTVLGRWCEGTTQCWALDKPYDASPAELAPYGKLKPPAYVLEVFCADLGMPDAGGYTLSIGGVQTPRQLLARATDAYGNLRAPAVVPRTSPGSPSVVQLDTWFWLPLAAFNPAVPLRGSSADGMVAIATAQDTTWDPGDGSATIVCAGAGVPYAAGASSDCTHVYRKASFSPQPTTDAKGNPAYQASITRAYGVRYEFYGVPVTVPGARLQFSVQTPFPVAVQEVQAENN
jgi:hypothetical protein